MNHRPPTVSKKAKRSLARSTLVAGVLLGALSASPQLASASPDTTTVFHLKGTGAHALLTDCLLTDTAGTHCRAVNVHAYNERIMDNGERFSGPGLNVTLFDVTILADEPFFVAEVVGFGHADRANVRINGFSGATASAADVPLCEDFECAPGAQESISVDVVWSGVGPIDRFKQHDNSFDGPCSDNVHGFDAARLATSAGTVDGVPWHQTNIPDLAPWLESDGFGDIHRCNVV